jgi:hypothetical protein
MVLNVNPTKVKDHSGLSFLSYTRSRAMKLRRDAVARTKQTIAQVKLGKMGGFCTSLGELVDPSFLELSVLSLSLRSGT